jgi:hypothetical protein
MIQVHAGDWFKKVYASPWKEIFKGWRSIGESMKMFVKMVRKLKFF